MSTHELDDKVALMGGGSIPNFVNGISSGSHGSIKTDGVIGAGDVIIDDPGNPHRSNSTFVKGQSSPERTFAADNNYGVNTSLAQVLDSLFLPFLSLKFFTAGSAQHSSAPLNNIGHRTEIHGFNIILYDSPKSFLNTMDLAAHIYSLTNNCPHGCVHAGSITATGHYSNFHLTLLLSMGHFMSRRDILLPIF